MKVAICDDDKNVLMDLDWGETKTGIRYAEQLYQTAPHIPVIYVTGYNDRFAQHILLQKTNLAGYLTKPIDDVLLKKYLRKVLDNRHADQNFSFQCQGRIVSIAVKQIVYLESRNHLSIVYKVIQSLLGKIEVTREYPYCGIPIINAILSEKEKECHANAVAMEQRFYRILPNTIQVIFRPIFPMESLPHG